MEIEGARVLVVGASSGIGRAIAEASLDRGARVVLSARRSELLNEIAATHPERAHVIVGDVTVADDCGRLAAAAIEELGGLDCLAYAAGFYRLRQIADADPDDWSRSLAVNVIGAALVTKASLPALRASRGRAVFLSSEVVLEPRAGLVPYGASKCALDHLVAGLRVECPDVAFTRMIIGATGGTDLGANTPRAELAEHFAIWEAAGFRPPGLMTPAAVAREVLDVIASDLDVRDVHLQPRAPGAES